MGQTIPGSTPGTYEVPVIKNGTVEFRKATPDEVSQRETSKRLSVWKERNDIIEGRLKAMSGDFMTPIAEKMRIAESAADEWMKMSGLQGFASGSGGTTSRPSGGGQSGQSEPSPLPQSGSAPQPSTTSKPSRVGMSQDQERYRLDRALSFPAFEMQLGSGQESVPVNFDTLFTRKPNGELAPNQEAFERMTAPSGKSGGVLQASGGGNNSMPSMVYQERLRSAYYEGKMAIENMQAKGKKVDPNALARIVNAILHGQDPRELLHRAGGK